MRTYDKAKTYCAEKYHRASALWRAVRGDGCTNVPDIHDAYTTCCIAHDRDYATHTSEMGVPLTRAKADARLRSCMATASKTFAGRWFVTPLYYVGVRLFGRKHWATPKT